MRVNGLSFCRRARRAPRYQAVIESLRHNVEAQHLKPILPPYQPFSSKQDRRRHANAEYRQHGAP